MSDEANPPLRFAGKLYTCVMGSDVERDGMFLELTELETGKAALEVFYSDNTGAMKLSAFVKDVPLEAAEWLIASAKVRLPPTKTS